MRTRTVFDINKVDYSKDNVVNLMVAMEAPPLPEDFKRSKAFIMSCLDCSGSMGGDKFESLKQTMYKLIDNLTDVDRLGIVWFGGWASLVSPVLMDSRGKEMMKNEVSCRHAGGGTPLREGVKKAFDEFGARKMHPDVVERVILLTDGQADTGQDTYKLVKSDLKESRGDITMSCFGYGADYNEALLESLSKDYCGGNYFVESVKTLPEAFANELGSLLSCYATGVKVSVAGVDKDVVSSISLLNDMSNRTFEDNGRTWLEINAGDMFYGEKKRVFLRIRCKAQPQPVDITDGIVSIRIERKPVDSDSPINDNHQPSLSFAKPEDVDLTPDAEVAEQVLVIDAANTQIEAKKLADQGEWQEAKKICDQVIENLEKYDSTYTRSFATVIRESSAGFCQDYSAGNAFSKCASSSAYTVLRSGRGMSGSIGMKAFSSVAYDSNNLTMSLVDQFTDKGEDGKEDKEEDKVT